MRSGVLIGAAMAVLSVRLLSGAGEPPAPEPVATRAAGAAAALLAGTAASAPALAPAGTAHSSAPGVGGVNAQPPALSSARAAEAAQAMRAASVEAEVRMRRTRGDDEDAVYRVRAAQLPAADVARLTAMEAAEAAWRRQLAASPDACGASCEASAPDHVVASAYRHDASPRLTLE